MLAVTAESRGAEAVLIMSNNHSMAKLLGVRWVVVVNANMVGGGTCVTRLSYLGNQPMELSIVRGFAFLGTCRAFPSRASSQSSPLP